MEEIGKLAGTFGNAYIVIEGNTDASRKGIVPADLVRQLSYDRADSVRKCDPGQIQVRSEQVQGHRQWLGQSIAGQTDASNAEHNKKNRRVEVKVFPLESN